MTVQTQDTTIKALSALAIAAFIALAITVLPGFAPNVEAGVPVALAKSDRLSVASGICAEASWPNVPAACLRGTGPQPVSTNVRLVTTDRR
ncbi:MAG: hypothetical protein J0G95_08600 [Rhizobiales bacterium]|nr:hypothetical protein [Hyphomicrobiales bacterium]